MKAIITDAGFASRYLPITKTIPKAMIPIGAKPVMQLCVEECVEAGIEEIIIVATPNTKSKEIYDDYSLKDDEPRETSPANKVMTKMMVDMKTIKDTSNSKLAELLMQGTNMGIIEGRRLLNQKDHIDEEVYEILKDFVEMQEDSIETLKKYL